MSKKNKPISFLQLITKSNILIPIIQRDFAQGRQNPQVNKIRAKFLDALFQAIRENEIIELDFIYGYNKKTKTTSKPHFIPLDGQQRLTTLFLIHWYVALRENKLDEVKALLGNFTYEVRHSTKEFCSRLVDFKPEKPSADIKASIVNQPWFFSNWEYDPSIRGMLVMLSAIEERYNKLGRDNIWAVLSEGKAPIVFYCLPMDKLGLADSLYIKMNSRGKPLTDFETFKSNFSTLIQEEERACFNEKIDKAWSDMFWKIYLNNSNQDFAQQMDEGIMRYFHFITDILAYMQGVDISETTDLLEKSNMVYKDKSENTKWLFDSLDKFEEIKDLSKYFNSLFYVDEKDFEHSKSRLFFNSATPNLLESCLRTYHSKLRSSNFAYGERLLLYAVILHLKEETADFPNRLRILRNLIANSEDEMRQEFYLGFLTATRELIVEGNYEFDASRFNKRQRNNEALKQNFLSDKPNKREILNKLEDHNILRGNLLPFDLNEAFSKHAQSFLSLFSSISTDYQKISKALMTFGDYSKAKSWRKWEYGNGREDKWRNIFTPTRGVDFHATKHCLNLLLQAHFKQEKSPDEIIADYLNTYGNPEKPKPFNYYFIKYPEFQFGNGQNGFYAYWTEAKLYEEFKMNKVQFNGNHWNPFLLELNKYDKKLTLEDNGNLLELKIKGAIFSFDSLDKGLYLKINKSKKAIKTIDFLIEKKHIHPLEDPEGYLFAIKQNEDGLDIEDRVVKAKELIDLIKGYKFY